MLSLSSLTRVMRYRAPRSQGTHESVAWRRRQLERAGFGRNPAQQLANDERVDLHAVLELIDQGCPPELAARIVAPLEDGPGLER